MWYRVNDALNPLCGADVLTGDAGHIEGDSRTFYEVLAVRRVDVFVGDRPYQLVAPPGQSLGIMVASDNLTQSPIQDEVVEIATDRPYGAVVEERDHDRSDSLRLRVVEYELMAQVALDDTASNTVLSSATVSLEGMRQIELDFVEGSELDEMQDLIISEGV